MLGGDFLADFKRATEARWSTLSIDPGIYGFQFQPGTRWNPGLSDEVIAQYENVLRARFPHDFRTFLRAMNGTDTPTLNTYGSCGEPPRQSDGVYSYPRDIEFVKQRIEHVRESRAEITADLGEQGFHLSAEAALVPIYGHRYLVCSSDLDGSVVLSIIVDDTDAIIYGSCLQEYLEKDFLQH